MKGRAAVVAIVAFVLVATACAVYAVRMTARTIDETAVAQASEAPEIARLYITKFGSLGAAAPSIVGRLKRNGLRVSLVDHQTGTWYSSSGAIRRLRRPRGLPPELRDGPAGPPGAPSTGFGGPDLFAGHPGPPPGLTGARRSDWTSILVATLAGESIHRAAIPGGEVVIVPEPQPVVDILKTVGIGLALVLFFSALALWLYVRGVRRAALRPLYETTLALQRLALRDFTPRTIVTGEGTAFDELARAYNAAVEAVASAFAERRAAEIEMQRFIADAGHEMRTPLTIVMGYLDIIAGGALADPAVGNRITSGMRTEATRMRKLIDKLIILARMETPSDIEVRSNIDVVSLVHRVIESLEPLALAPIEVSGVPFAHVFAGEDDIAEALTNIIENALKYAPRSPIGVHVERTGDRIIIAVRDRGPGMSTDEQRNAFERFYRGEKRGEVSGSGLGLAIAKRAIERSRGTIRLDSVCGAGTTFTIELPEMPIAVGEPRSSQLTRR